MLAAFYTRPQAAELLAHLTITEASDTVFDPACGSATILIAAYRQKHELAGPCSRDHRRFCEHEIFGADIMPFAVHLATANLAAMEPGTIITRTQIIHGDSLKFSRGHHYRSGLQPGMPGLLPAARVGYMAKGEEYEVDLEPTDVVLMNPPFTKVERGIAQYVDMQRFSGVVGGEVGLWGHFLRLADDFLKTDGMFGGVIPISIMRGRESEKVREFLFRQWTPLYLIKATGNYGFSEWAEYPDILVIARKRPCSFRPSGKGVLYKEGPGQNGHARCSGDNEVGAVQARNPF